MFAERIRAAVAERPFDIGEGVGLTKQCSVGFACFPFVLDQPRAVGWEQVVGLADRALYAAKRGGRNAWVGLFAADGVALAGEAYDAITQKLPAAVRTGTVRVATRLPEDVVEAALVAG
jgi:hypothetical protein